MNKMKKVLALTLAFAVVICATVFATLAYLSDKTQVAKNTFTLGKVDIKLDEAVVDETGKATDDRTQTGNNDVVTGNDGEDYGYALVPGKQVDKDPTVHVIKNSEECYVRVKVTLKNATAFATIFQKHNSGVSGVEAAIAAMKEYFVGYDETVWQYADAKLENGDLTVTFNYKEKVAKNTSADTDLPALITAVKLPEYVDSEDAAALPNFEVEIIAEAIQAEGFDDADAAWAAFEAQTTTVSGEGQP